MLRHFKWIIKLVGEIGFPKRKTTLDQLEFALKSVVIGDVVLFKKRFELSNFFIKGFWKHSTIYVGDGMIVQATAKGVRKEKLCDEFLKSDYWCIIRPIRMNEDLCCKLLDIADSFVGAEYDYEFSFSNKAYYCSEVVYDILMGVELIGRIDSIVIEPSYFYTNGDDFKVIKESKG